MQVALKPNPVERLQEKNQNVTPNNAGNTNTPLVIYKTRPLHLSILSDRHIIVLL